MIGQSLEGTYRDLMKLSPDQLVGMLNAQDNWPPKSLVLSALQGQEEARQAMQSPPSPQPTVAQQLVQKAVPPPPQRLGPPPYMGMSAPPAAAPAPAPSPIDQGVASLPLQEEPRYEGGGIVSFAGGGLNDSDYSWIYGNDPEPYNLGLFQKWSADPEEFRKLLKKDRELARKRQEAKLEEASKYTKSAEAQGREPPPPMAITPTTPSTPPTLPGADKDTVSPFQPFMDLMNNGASYTPFTPSGKYPDFVPGQAPEAAQTPEQQKAREEAAMAAYGVDPNFYGKLREETIGKEAELKDERSKQNWLDLASGFLRMAQTPGSFGTALAAGAGEALRGVGETGKEYRQEQKEIDRYKRQIAISENERNMGRADRAMDREDAAKDRLVQFQNNEAARKTTQAIDEYKFETGIALSNKEAQDRFNLEKQKLGVTLGTAMLEREDKLQKYQYDVIKTAMENLASPKDWDTAIARAAEKISDADLQAEFKKQGKDPTTVDAATRENIRYRLAADIVAPYMNAINSQFGGMMGLGSLGRSLPTANKWSITKSGQ